MSVDVTYIVLVDALLDLGNNRVGLAAELDHIAELHVGALVGDLDGLLQLALNSVNVALHFLDGHCDVCEGSMIGFVVIWNDVSVNCYLVMGSSCSFSGSYFP